VIPNDSATLTGATANAGGTLTFALFAPSDLTCGGTPAYTQTVNVSGNGKYDTTNTSFVSTDAGTWRWLVSYSGDSSNNPRTLGCGVENFTITNDCTSGNAPTLQRARVVRRAGAGPAKPGINWTRLMLIGIP
jgi:hypothetical protein